MKKGTSSSLLFLSAMTENVIHTVEQMVDEMLQPYPEYFRVNVKIKPTNNLKVFIDGDNGITIEKCVAFNRSLYKKIEEKGFFPAGDFSLEVSSPGLDEPLKMQRQFIKNKGRHVEVVFLDGTKREGKLIEATNEDLLLEITEGKGKKAVTQQIVIPFLNIKSTTVQIKF